MQLSRLFEIVILLLDRKTATAAELAHHFGVSPRTIYRDIDALSQAGIPVYATQGKNGGIALMESFVLQKSLLNREEQSEILSALQGLNAVGMTQVESLLTKWRVLFGPGDGEWIAVDFSDWSQTRQHDLQLTKDAILNKKVLCFTYYSASGEMTRREAEPVQLWFKSRAWYLKAYCRLRGGERLFKLSRMKDLHLSGELFTLGKKADAIPDDHFGPVKPSVSLRLWIDGSQAYRVYDEFDESQVEKQPDGHFHVSVSYLLDEWVYGFLLSFGSYLKVLAPDSVKCVLHQRIAKMAGFYSEYDS